MFKEEKENPDRSVLSNPAPPPKKKKKQLVATHTDFTPIPPHPSCNILLQQPKKT